MQRFEKIVYVLCAIGALTLLFCGHDVNAGITTAAITAVVIQRNHISYAECGGLTMKVPTGADVDVLAELWAKPVKDNGIFRGWDLVAGTLAQPTPDSFKVTRLKDKEQGDVFHVLGTNAQYLASSADNGVTLMPLATTIPVIVPEYQLCDDGSGNFDMIWTPPAKVGSDEYKVYVTVDNVAQTAPPATGHTDLAAAVTWLNANVAGAGTWSAVTGRLKLHSTTKKKVGVTFVVGNFA